MNQDAVPNVTKWCDGLKFNRFHGLLVILGVLTLIFDGYDSQILSYVLPQMLKEWHLSPVMGGSIVTWGSIGVMIGSIGLGMLADRIGRKIPLILGLFMFSFFSGALYWAPDFKTFVILRFLAGLGIGGGMTLTITYASEFAPARIRGAMVTTMFIGFMIGPAIAGTISILCVPVYGWRIVLFFGFLPLVFIPFLYWLMPESIRFLAQKGQYDRAIKEIRRMERAAHVAPQKWVPESFVFPPAYRASVKHLFTSKLAAMTILIWIVYFMNLVIVYGVTTWLPTLLVKQGVPLVRSYGYTMMQHLGGALGTVLVGFAVDKFGRKQGLFFTYLLAGISTWLFGLAVGSPIALYVIGGALGFFIIGGNGGQHVVTGEIYPTQVRSTGVGWGLTAGRFGAACGPVLGGLLQSAGVSFNHYFAWFAIPAFLSALLTLFYRINVKGEDLETVTVKLATTDAE